MPFVDPDFVDPDQIKTPDDGPKAKEKPSLGSRLLGGIQAGLSMASAIPASMIGNVSGIVKGVTGGKIGTAEGVREAEKTASDITQALTYSPGSEAGQVALSDIGKAFDASKLSGLGPTESISLSAFSPKVGPAKTYRMKPELQAARDAGYVTTPTQMEAGLTNRLISGLSGASKQEVLASTKNAPKFAADVANDLNDSLKALGAKPLPDGRLSQESLAYARSQAAPYYNAIDNIKNVHWDPQFDKEVSGMRLKSEGGAIRHPAQEGLNELKDNLLNHPKWSGESLRSDITLLREMASDNYAAAKIPGGKSEKFALAQVQSQAAEMLENLAERNLKLNKVPSDTIEKYRKARQLFAQTFTVDEVLNDTTGHVSAPGLRKMLDQKKPLSPGMRKVAEFAKAYEGAARDVDKIKGKAEFDALDYISGGAAGAGAHAAGAAFSPAIALAAIGARPAARHLQLTPFYQNLMANPVPLSGILKNPIQSSMVPLSQIAPYAKPESGGY